MTISLLKDKKIVLGVTGSIACYKTADLASKLTQAGALVDVVMTESAQKFVSPITFQSVTGRPVYTDLWDEQGHVAHVKLGESADLVAIIPATAHTLAKLAHGLADNFLTVTALAARCPILVAPAMDGGMFGNAATQANVAILRERGIIFAGPAEGRMASGLVGKGRMLEVPELIQHMRLTLARNGKLAGKHIVVSTGPTREAIDPVRFVSNRSSGKQGLALAQAALDAGACVTLIAGPISEPIPVGMAVVNVTTAQEMYDAVLASVDQADALCMVAAVADYRPSTISTQKIKKTKVASSGLSIDMERTLDILESVKKSRATSGYPKIVLGFAAETNNAAEYGRSKLERKGMDFIAINDVSQPDAGFGTSTNRVLLVGKGGFEEELGLLSKTSVAEKLIETISTSLSSGE